MDFTLSQEQEQLAESVRGFARRQLADRALERAHDPNFPWDLARELAAQSLLGLTIPESDGGQGAGLLDAVVAIQELAMVCPTAADVVQAGNFGAIRTLAEYADEDQKKRFLPDLLAGDALIALGMSESEAGSAVTDLQTSVTADGDGYRINGRKLWSTHSTDATVYLVYARFGPGTGGIGSVLVERDRPGLTVGPPSLYMSGEQWSELVFDDCWIPAGNVLLGAGGFKKQISGFNVERIGNASRALALGRHAYTVAREHVLTREQFGRPLCEFQGVQWKFAEMATKLEAAQLMLYRAAHNADRGLPSAQETSMAKLAANTAGFEVANEAVQLMGAMGYSSESLVEYCFRRTRGWMIAGGSLEILKNRIAEGVFGRRFDQRPPR
ncbi:MULTISPECIES: acyl-CoA dehydrogenase family protein [Pseudonocardia]|uniref:Acyl-CoA dehydrogenase n=2 Tax=Pseudonocardia TaxID=1847 RepID=A0A1Y2MKN2_PSEAH|nr:MULTISPECIES: acyl-CoA dehydrogenase [Pseudonocardia]OSY35836.1 Acyl-CoA dehydrogenase [Pseudonocardia autotrophica]TDN73130.1 alkylation response protein AidB-like acyl-CoA dehydrogenase [Pseudonocardia autotrophica]BBG03849.1 acyl-CoA dehydrogenase [Pseudonocardia autotrophica]GEC27352.1 acyl-CoA dehydrogenase [Pseudonocardia saturnea]